MVLETSPNHGSSGSQSPLQKRIANLEFVVQRLQKQMTINDDHLASKTFMEGEGDEILTRELCRRAKFEITRGTRSLKTSIQETMIMEEGMKIDTTMMITMRNVIMMKVPNSIQSLIFRNLKEECMPMTSWIGLISSNVSLSIVIPLSGKR